MKKLNDFNTTFSSPALEFGSGALTIVPSANDLKVDLHNLLVSNGHKNKAMTEQANKDKSFIKRSFGRVLSIPSKLAHKCGFVSEHKFAFDIKDINGDGKTTIELAGQCHSKIIAPNGKCVINHEACKASKVYSLQPGEYIMEVKYA
jgi:hypothetical protein